MSNVVPLNLNRASLEEMALYIQSLDQSNAINCWHIAETLSQAKDVCDEDGTRWADYVEEEVGYSVRQADDYVRVERCLSATGAELSEKGCSFNTLKALSAEKLPKAERRKLLDRLRKKSKITQADCSKIQADVKAALPEPKATIAQIAGDIDLPVFSERLAKCVRDENIGGTYLFALRDDCNIEDIKTVAKIYKQKYHPDKGGTSEEFDAICRAEQAFIESKEGGAK